MNEKEKPHRHSTVGASVKTEVAYKNADATSIYAIL